MRLFYVYILAKHRHGALYVGVTNNLIRRVYEHRGGLVSGFTKRYGIKQLVYFEQHPTAGFGDSAREDDEAVAPRLEDSNNREDEPHLGGPLRRDLPIDPIGWPGQAPAMTKEKWPGQADKCVFDGGIPRLSPPPEPRL